MTRRALLAAIRGLRHAPRLAVAAVVCAVLPAHRASTIDPMTALKGD
ncbi:MAG TPA: hypothetical protein VFV98_03330 [Vicinamibacterales bacterium]|nr:hypothetical protein [Vicinamibacterales bacterium]